MKYEIGKTFSFEAAHSLPGLPKGHKCRNIHGHHYTVTVICRGEMAPEGWVVDYGDIKKTIAPLINKADHSYLNDWIPYHPTAEALARWFYEHLKGEIPELYQIRVQETASTYALFPVRP